MTCDRIRKYAAGFAAHLEPNGKVSGKKTASETGANLRVIGQTVEKLRAASPSGETARSEWLLDNWYLVQREAADVRLHLSACGKLPAERGTAVLERLCGRYLTIAGLSAEEETLTAFLEGVQTVYVLSEKELCFLIPFLKAELLRRLAEACEEKNGAPQKEANFYKAVFLSLRFLSGFDPQTFFESVNRLDRILFADPAGVYPRMDELTKREYRSRITVLARKEGVSEYTLAQEVIRRAEQEGNCHIGQLLFPESGKKREKRGNLYITAVLLLSLFFSVLMGILLENILVTLLLVPPISEICKNVLDYLILKTSVPKRIPRMKPEHGIGENSRTLCVISAMLSSADAGKKGAEVLEQYLLANRSAGSGLLFGLLADLPESEHPGEPYDREYLSSAEKEMDRLNRKYGDRFCLFYRNRVFQKTQGRYMGWERKRGAVYELMFFLRGEKTGIVSSLSAEKLQGIRYVVALDGDTRPGIDAITELVGAMEHPANRAVVDPRTRTVKKGYGILQPRISTALESANRTPFSKIFAGLGGVDPYGSIASDVYQNMLREGSFNGKGIIDVDAYTACLKDRFQEEIVLSHDLLEGALLRTGYIGDVEFTDSYPEKVLSYYDRMHRWVRGDWQNAGWISRKSPLKTFDRWKVLDNLRRSMVPVFTFLALLSGVFVARKDFLVAAMAAVLAQLTGVLLSSVESLAAGGETGKWRSSVFAGSGLCFMQTLLKLLLLPYEAFVNVSAVLMALYRMRISRRNLLQWVTAAESDRKTRGTLKYYYGRMWFCVLVCAAVCAFAWQPFWPAIGLVWLTAPLFAWSMSRPWKAMPELTVHEKHYLVSKAGDIWKYFADNLTAEDHFLPPDNYQIQPFLGRAHRTSPTNIGLAILAAVSACDLGIITREKCREMAGNVLCSAERLRRWNGHFYNWYDTETLKVLEPAYVSTVDSGNLAGCLLAAERFFTEIEDDFLAGKANALYREMNFAPLYDKRKNLFYIGWDCDKNCPAESWYDLFESEARQTSFLAVARGDVPKKHWKALCRVAVRDGGYCGMASWTGTMFEYLMPNLLLPCYENSAAFESAKFCIAEQMKRAAFTPWGISECAYYSFDHSMNYRYKAHGVRKLALDRKTDSAPVVSPYSTFLALTLEPGRAIRNLKRLAKYGAEGKYGFYEAVDFSQSSRSGKKVEVVRTFMVHHLGMSIAAVNNAVNGNILQKRFMASPEMQAYRDLLQEKIPFGQITVQSAKKEAPEKPKRYEDSGWCVSRPGTDAIRPACTVLSDGVYNVLVLENGKTRSQWGDLLISRFRPEPDSRSGGMLFWLRIGEKVFALQPEPSYDESIRYGWEFHSSFCRFTAESERFASEIDVSVSSREIGEKRTVRFRLKDRNAGKAELICAMEPVLCRQADYEAHPAFSKLTMEVTAGENGVLLKRRSRGSGHAEYAAVRCTVKVQAEVSRQKMLGRGGLQEMERAQFSEKTESSSPDLFLFLKTTAEPADGPEYEVSFAVAPAKDGEAAAEVACRILKETLEDSELSYLDTAARFLGLDPGMIPSVMEDVPELLYPTAEEPSDTSAVTRETLWKLGISGDCPVVCCTIESDRDIAGALRRVRQHAFLAECGVKYDLAVITADGGDYRQGQRNAVMDYLKSVGLEWIAETSGGVHIVDSRHPDIAALRACCRKLGTMRENVDEEPAARLTTREIKTGTGERGHLGTFRWTAGDGTILLDADGKLPDYAWSNILANERFGWLATESGSGFLWHLNSRENKINRFENDPCAQKGGEDVRLCRGDREYSLFAREDGCRCRVTFGRGYAVWEKDCGGVHAVMTAFVPQNVPARVLMLELDGLGETDTLLYSTDLLLGPDRIGAEFLTTEFRENVFTARRNPGGEFPGECFHVLASETAKAWTGSMLGYLSGKLDGKTGGGMLPCAALRYPARAKMILVTGCGETEMLQPFLSEEAAKAALGAAKEWWKALTEKVRVETPHPELDRYLNGWAAYQTIAGRLFAKTSIYQNGGAFGFRDQLQDVSSLLFTLPELAREQLLRAAAHQYEEGDVFHWWHETEAGDRGVRTRCSDDFLWMIDVLSAYVSVTGDAGILKERAPYLHSAPLSEMEAERYERPETGKAAGTLLEHAERAAALLMKRGVGRHGLCKMGSGDWNDGMNLVGAGGEGESVWLTWFAALCLDKLTELCRTAGKEGPEYARFAEKLRQAAHESWTGKWFLRGYYDDGSPLGAGGEECGIDSLAQSFAGFCMPGDARVKTALKSAFEALYDPNTGITKLLDPPFDAGQRNPGYIRQYCPGYRENGGQYTHAAIWLAMALLKNGMEEEGSRLLLGLLPENHDPAVYKREPYILPADVYTNKDWYGLAGWTWYTGAAGWFRRAALEWMLGMTVRDKTLAVEPNLPAGWEGYRASAEIFGKPLEIRVKKGESPQITEGGAAGTLFSKTSQ